MRSGGQKSPSGVQGWSPGRGLGAKPQKLDIYKQFAAVKCFSMQVCCRVRPPSPLPPQRNSLDPHESHDPTRSGQAGNVPTCGYATGWS